MEFEWNRSVVLGAAREACAHCQGIGLRHGNEESKDPCNCVLRKIFVSCYQKFRSCAVSASHISVARLEHVTGGRDNSQTWGMKSEEYMADFYLVTKRSLNEFEWQLFRFHFLLGADWKLCSRRLGMDKGRFFHAVYRIEQKLGRAYRELQPYALFPLDEYFGGAVHAFRDPERKVVEIRFGPRGGKALRPPVRKVNLELDTEDRRGGSSTGRASRSQCEG